jgi:adenosylcobinamide kinase/adenosylcobinamide-phosphate guanylyltransferase
MALAMAYTQRVFIATAEACDPEMARRIERHRQERGETFDTIEEPLDLCAALRGAPAPAAVVVVDCLPVWLGNLTYHERFQASDESCTEIDDFLGFLRSPPRDVVLVTGEIGLGIVPADPSTRLYRDRLGRLNRNVAKLAETVYLVVSGIPLQLKPAR